MLDLQAGVHLEEVERLVLAGDELDRAGAVVVHGLGQRDRLLAHLAAGGLIEQRRRRLLQHLLVTALDRAFAFAEINDVAVLVAQHLDLDMAGVDDELLDEDTVVAEGGRRLRLGAGEALGDLSRRMGDAHALAAAAGRGLDHHGIADLVGDLDRVLGVLDHAEMARNRRDLGGGRRLLRFDLVAHRGDRAGIGADEDDAVVLQRLGEGLALGEEAVAGMNGLRARLLAGGDDLVDLEIGLGGWGGADMHGLIRHLDMQRITIGIGIDRHRLDAHPLCRLDDAAGDLATVRDQNLREHAWFPPGPEHSLCSAGFTGGKRIRPLMRKFCNVRKRPAAAGRERSVFRMASARQDHALGDRSDGNPGIGLAQGEADQGLVAGFSFADDLEGDLLRQRRRTVASRERRHQPMRLVAVDPAGRAALPDREVDAERQQYIGEERRLVCDGTVERHQHIDDVTGQDDLVQDFTLKNSDVFIVDHAPVHHVIDEFAKFVANHRSTPVRRCFVSVCPCRVKTMRPSQSAGG
ncbi:conserved hypothetical protein [Bosea sp. EC-HK365B]|nr:conserved hypothetical protein [Bosea sp. 46]CAD5267076.1 conserved hypothetical protein [Bosea sp. 21B]CAD5272152.1 conserved hypothetical protein [Bosea sp. 7B]VVT55968.1 conserved hypothetical protein [Bosea sp. EC-HK365B]VXB83542.1 conserved hypothetical protein [Bosea sp. 29B]VXC22384.1 conserved hypothetical protein [Bosea sp. 125]VXC69729.1 conserved hypothetical protein [Bosea sp. 127]